MQRLLNKIVLITGAASRPGLGSSTAIKCASEGAKLVLTDIDEAGLAPTVKLAEEAGAEVLALRHDVTSEADWEAVVTQVKQRFDGLDVLVNNAGIAILRPLAEMTMDEYRKQMDVNMTSVFIGTQACLPLLCERESSSIVNLSSVAGLVGLENVSAYCASKGGVRLFSKAIAIEYAGRGVRCNSIHPGIIWTNIQQASLKDNPAVFEQLNASIPLGRMGSAEDVANCVAFLASDEAGYVTGAELAIDGGLTAS
jgi:NAD(P)-dependent dehydrogenase (short-subunit alcohol dehydrogenase family)